MSRVTLILITPFIAYALLFSEALPATESRASMIARAHVWTPTNVGAMAVKTGPSEPGAFPFLAAVPCEYSNTKLGGRSPKFACKVGPDDEVKVKFGGANGEVYAEVLATRLLWALGFGADRMYPVRVICRRCPPQFGGVEQSDGTRLFDPAVIERKMPGDSVPTVDSWSWQELEKVDEKVGGAPRAHRDALKLLAVFIQHTDSKPEQQRLMCLDDGETDSRSCARPFMLLQDVGVTFGQANTFNSNANGSMNFGAWSRTPVWKDATKCIGNLPKSFTGTLDNPAISEEGRRFLADLLGKLSDSQLHDLFEVSRAKLRLRSPMDPKSGVPTIEDWVDVFKRKRDEVATRSCN